MIKEVNGDILLTEAKVIAHSIAPMDHFDSGLALGLREKYPAMVKDFRHYCHNHNPEPGDIWVWGGVGGLQIVNMMAQEPAESRHSSGHPGKAKISYLDHCLKKLAKWAEKEGIGAIALPKVATGVGGLDWEEVRALLYKHLGESNTNIFVYSSFVKNEKAVEG